MKKRALLNFITSVVYQFSNILIGLVLPRFYTEIFGSVYNGLNQSISQIMSLLSVLQLGIAAVSIQQMFQYIATNDTNMIGVIYSDTSRQYRRMGYIFLIVIIPLTFLFPLLIHDNIPYWTIVAFFLFRIISSAMEYFFQGKYSVILIAHNKSYSIYLINILLLLIGTACHFAVLFITQNIILYQAVAVFTTLLRFVIVGTYVNKSFSFLKHRSKISYVAKKDASRKDALVSEVAGVIIDSTDLLVLSTFVGLASASIYSIYSFVVSGIGNVLSSCREAVFAAIGKTYYENHDNFKIKTDRFESIYLALTFTLYSITIILFKPFVEIYTANMDIEYYYLGFPVLFVLARLVVNLRIPAITVINSAGHFKQVKWFAVIEALINILVSVILVKPLGIYGVLIGTIVAACYRTPVLVHYVYKHILKVSAVAYIKKILLWLPVFIVSYISSIFIHIQCNSLLEWLFVAIIVAIIISVFCICWMLIFDKQTIRLLISMIKKGK